MNIRYSGKNIENENNKTQIEDIENLSNSLNGKAI